MDGTTEKSSGAAGPPAFQGILDRILDPSTPLALKMSAARGVLPLPPDQVLGILVALLGETQPGISEVAAQSLEEHAGNGSRLQEILQEENTASTVLAYFGKRMAGTGETEILRTVVTHPNTPVDTLKNLAASEAGEVLEAILLNENRLIQSPVLLEGLKSNPQLSPRQQSRIREIEVQLIQGTIATAVPEAAVPPPSETPVPGVPQPSPFEDPGETLPQDLVAEPGAAAPAEEEEEEEAPSQAVERIQRMAVPEKIQLTISADREERMILIRDNNKLVATSMLKSPKVTDKDVESFAAMRNVQEDILRIIGGKRSWVKNYTVTHALVQNPRTPSGIALKLLARLNTRDLKMLAANRNIPEVVRRMARKYWQGRIAPPKQLRPGKK